MNEARAGAVGADRRPWVERALVPALLGGIFSLTGLFAVHISSQTRELRAEVGDVRSELGEVKGRLDGLDRRLDGVDQRIDSLRDGVNERLGRIEDRMGRIEALLMAQRLPPNSGL